MKRPVQSPDHGQITIFLVLFVVACVVVGGLVVDGGFVLAARRRVIVQADAAARAGADALSPDAYRSTGRVVLDTTAAAAAAHDFLDAAGLTGDVEVSGDRVIVVAREWHATALLGLIGIRGMDLSGRGEARAVMGVSAAA